MKTPERHHRRRSGALLLNFNIFSNVSIVDLEHVNVSWALSENHFLI